MAQPDLDAVFCGSDQIAAGFMETARERAAGACPRTSR